MKKHYLSLLLLSAISLNAQQYVCNADKVSAETWQKYPELAKLREASEARIASLTKDKSQSKLTQSAAGVATPVYEIPIVVHVISNGDPIGTTYNHSDTQIQEWVDWANTVFAGTAPGFSNSAPLPVKLVLAKRDPNCNPTNGIVRIDGNAKWSNYRQYGIGGTNGVSQADIRNSSRWNDRFYYNIYIINNFGGSDVAPPGGTVSLGVATPPPTNPGEDDAFMVSRIVNVGQDATLTFPHEMGHAFGLFHTFRRVIPETTTVDDTGTVCSVETDSRTQGDKVYDTNPILMMYTCPANTDINTCTGKPYAGEQYNVMGYTSCKDRFTPGQAERVAMVLEDLRYDLITSKAGQPFPIISKNFTSTSCFPITNENPGNDFDLGPRRVIFGKMRYVSKGYSGDGHLVYIDHSKDQYNCVRTDNEATVVAGSTVTLSVSIQANTQNVRAYIDYNNDGIFDIYSETVFSEKIDADSDNTKETSATTNVPIPTNAVMNTPLRMRVTADYYLSPAPTPCYAPTYKPHYGQVEDFLVTIIPNGTLSTHENSTTKESIKVYPNPTDSVLNITADQSIDTIQVFDMSGRLAKEVKASTQSKELKIDIRSLKTGNYLVKVNTADNKSHTYPVIKK